mgnify:CR=1 FL=1
MIRPRSMDLIRLETNARANDEDDDVQVEAMWDGVILFLIRVA